MRSLPVEVWGGVECTVNRVGDAYFDQLERSGHARRSDDLDRIAALGIRTLRYPVLWERTAPGAIEAADFRWSDERLARIAALGIRPIVGLVHHGSGPAHTSLCDEGFVGGLAAFGELVARRYPGVLDFTPVNEPLTTARFSGLYGQWYPHARSARTFVRALLIQIQATIAAMRAIRRVTPDARLVQTEDLGTVSATPSLAYQAEFENHRRFLTFDLLCGRVTREHPLHGWLVGAGGATPRELAQIAAAPCPPDVIGINHYVTSDRFLDDRIHLYPTRCHGDNGRHRYADVETVRVHPDGITGHLRLLELAYRRYRRPVALTEVHLGCGVEEQIRWFAEAMAGAQEAARRGVDVRGVTAWALFGSYDWDSLVVLDRGHYEPGAYAVLGGAPRPTELATVVEHFAKLGATAHPAATSPGWWRRPQRLLYAIEQAAAGDAA